MNPNRLGLQKPSQLEAAMNSLFKPLMIASCQGPFRLGLILVSATKRWRIRARSWVIGCCF